MGGRKICVSACVCACVRACVRLCVYFHFLWPSVIFSWWSSKQRVLKIFFCSNELVFRFLWLDNILGVTTLTLTPKSIGTLSGYRQNYRISSAFFHSRRNSTFFNGKCVLCKLPLDSQTSFCRSANKGWEDVEFTTIQPIMTKLDNVSILEYPSLNLSAGSRYVH